MTPLIVIECNHIGIKNDFSFMAMNFLFVYISEHYMSESLVTSNKITSERSTRHLKIDKALFNNTNRCLLVKTLKMFRIPCML